MADRRPLYTSGVSANFEQFITRSELLKRARERKLYGILLFSPLVVYSILFPLVRETGPIAFLVVVASALAGMFVTGLYYAPKYLIGYILVSTLYLAASFLNVLGTSWTQYWIAEAAIRQWLLSAIIPIVIASYLFFFEHFKKHIIRSAVIYLLILYALTRLSFVFASSFELNLWRKLTLYTFTSQNSIIVFIIACILIFRIRPTWLSFFLCLVLAPIFTSAQSLFMYIILLIIWRFAVEKITIFAVTAAFISLSLAAPLFVVELYNIDHNTGLRALLWRDAIDAVVATNAIGVGYGTEYIKNDFYILAEDWYLTADDSDDRLSIGTHSSLYDVAFRTGILGTLLILLWFSGLLRTCFDRSNFSVAMYKMNVFSGCMLVVINTVNMGLTTVNFLMSTSLYAAWLVSSARSVKRRRNGGVARPADRRKQKPLLT